MEALTESINEQQEHDRVFRNYILRTCASVHEKTVNRQDFLEAARERLADYRDIESAIFWHHGIAEPDSDDVDARLKRQQILRSYGLTHIDTEITQIDDFLSNLEHPVITERSKKSEWTGFFTDPYMGGHFGTINAIVNRLKQQGDIDITDDVLRGILTSREDVMSRPGIGAGGQDATLYLYEQLLPILVQWHSEPKTQEDNGVYQIEIDGNYYASMISLARLFNVDKRTVGRIIADLGVRYVIGHSGSRNRAKLYPVFAIGRRIGDLKRTPIIESEGENAGFVMYEGELYGTVGAIARRCGALSANALQIRLNNYPGRSIRTIYARLSEKGRNVELRSYSDVMKHVVNI